MKLLYQFEMMDMGDEIIAVPVGDNADSFHGVIKVNETAKEMLELIAESNTPEEVHRKLCENHPEDDPNEIGQQLCDYLNKCIRAGILDPRTDK